MVAMAIPTLMVLFAISFPQIPYSDYEQFRQQAVSFADYTKGGILSLIYSWSFTLFPVPAQSALLVNISSWFVFIFSVAPTSFRNKLSYFVLTFGLACSGVWWIWCASTMEIMTVCIAFCALAGRLLYESIIAGNHRKSTLLAAVSFVFFVVVFSMRMQMAVVTAIAGILIVMFYGLELLSRKSKRTNLKRGVFGQIFASTKTWVVFVATLVGVFVDKAFRLGSNRQLDLEISDRAQFYIGLFLPDRSPLWCGTWRPESIAPIANELNLSLFEVASKYLHSTNLSDFFALASCKINRSLTSATYITWVPKSASNLSSVADVESWMYTVEIASNLLLKAVFVIAFVIMTRKFLETKNTVVVICYLVLAAFLADFAILEFNPRYFWQMSGVLLSLYSIYLKTQEEIDGIGLFQLRGNTSSSPGNAGRQDLSKDHKFFNSIPAED